MQNHTIKAPRDAETFKSLLDLKTPNRANLYDVSPLPSRQNIEEAKFQQVSKLNVQKVLKNVNSSYFVQGKVIQKLKASTRQISSDSKPPKTGMIGFGTYTSNKN